MKDKRLPVGIHWNRCLSGSRDGWSCRWRTTSQNDEKEEEKLKCHCQKKTQVLILFLVKCVFQAVDSSEQKQGSISAEEERARIPSCFGASCARNKARVCHHRCSAQTRQTHSAVLVCPHTHTLTHSSRLRLNTTHYPWMYGVHEVWRQM